MITSDDLFHYSLFLESNCSNITLTVVVLISELNDYKNIIQRIE